MDDLPCSSQRAHQLGPWKVHTYARTSTPQSHWPPRLDTPKCTGGMDGWKDRASAMQLPRKGRQSKAKATPPFRGPCKMYMHVWAFRTPPRRVHIESDLIDIPPRAPWPQARSDALRPPSIVLCRRPHRSCISRLVLVGPDTGRERPGF